VPGDPEYAGSQRHTGEQVADDDRKAQPAGNQTRNQAGSQNDQQIENETIDVHYRFVPESTRNRNRFRNRFRQPSGNFQGRAKWLDCEHEHDSDRGSQRSRGQHWRQL
jgi:hypothetical protein